MFHSARFHSAGLPFVCALCSVVPSTANAANEALARAERLVSTMKYAEADRALKDAWAAPGNDRATVIRILELRGIGFATRFQDERAIEFFRMLLAVDPDHVLASEYSPRVRTPFYEAKSWIGEHGTLSAEPIPALVQNDKPVRIGIKLKSDPLQLARFVRFHQRAASAPWQVVEASIRNSSADADAGTDIPVQWWAELLNEHHGVVFVVGTEGSPITQPEPPPLPPPPPAEIAQNAATQPNMAAVPVTGPETPQAPTVSPPSGTPPAGTGAVAEARWRPGAYTALGVGAAGLIGGVVCGLLSFQANAKLNAITVNGVTVSGISQQDAYALQSQAVTEAICANALYAAGGALAVTGAVLWWAGGRVSVEPRPGGIALSGTF